MNLRAIPTAYYIQETLTLTGSESEEALPKRPSGARSPAMWAVFL